MPASDQYLLNFIHSEPVPLFSLASFFFNFIIIFNSEDIDRLCPPLLVALLVEEASVTGFPCGLSALVHLVTPPDEAPGQSGAPQHPLLGWGVGRPKAWL